MELAYIDIKDLAPSALNVRKHSAKEGTKAGGELAESIRKLGLQQPLLVRPNGKVFDIGHRRKLPRDGYVELICGDQHRRQRVYCRDCCNRDEPSKLHVCLYLISLCHGAARTRLSLC